jgi:hypothetical protein
MKGGVAHNPFSNMKSGCGIAPICKFIEKGILVGLGTDGAGSAQGLNKTFPGFSIEVTEVMSIISKKPTYWVSSNKKEASIRLSEPRKFILSIVGTSKIK